MAWLRGEAGLGSMSVMAIYHKSWPIGGPTWRDIALPLMVGLISLAVVMRRPRFASIHMVDVLELIAAGVMFGLALRACSMWIHDHINHQ